MYSAVSETIYNTHATGSNSIGDKFGWLIVVKLC